MTGVCSIEPAFEAFNAEAMPARQSVGGKVCMNKIEVISITFRVKKCKSDSRVRLPHLQSTDLAVDVLFNSRQKLFSCSVSDRERAVRRCSITFSTSTAGSRGCTSSSVPGVGWTAAEAFDEDLRAAFNFRFSWTVPVN